MRKSVRWSWFGAGLVCLVYVLVGGGVLWAAPTSRPVSRAATGSAVDSGKSAATSRPRQAGKLKVLPAIASSSVAQLRFHLSKWELRMRAAKAQLSLVRWRRQTRKPFLSTASARMAWEAWARDKGFYAFLRKALPRAKGHPVLERRLSLWLQLLARFHRGDRVDRSYQQMHRLRRELEARILRYRPMVRGKRRTMREIRSILATSPDRRLREEAWRAAAQLGRILRKHGLMQLFRWRNRYAQWMRFGTYFHWRYPYMQMPMSTTFLEYKRLRKSSSEAKKHLLRRLKRMQGGQAVMPWDRRYLERKLLWEVMGGEELWAGRSVVSLARRMVRDMGFSVDKVRLREGRADVHGWSDAVLGVIEAPWDVRLWAAPAYAGEVPMQHLLRALGKALHAVSLSSQVRTFRALPVEGFLSEVAGAFLSQQVTTLAFARRYLGLSSKRVRHARQRERLLKDLRLAQLRASMLGMAFEEELYTNTGVSDPSDGYWRLYRKYVGPVPPKPPPAWGMMLRIVRAPCTYQDRLLAEMVASQLVVAYRKRHPDGLIIGDSRVGPWLQEVLFRGGRRERWDRVIRRMTGGKLSHRPLLKSLQMSSSR